MAIQKSLSKWRDSMHRTWSNLFKPVIAIENPEPIRSILPKQSVINRGHDLGADHRAPVFARQERGRLLKILLRTVRLELH